MIQKQSCQEDDQEIPLSKNHKIAVVPLFTSIGLKLINLQTKQTTLFDFQNLDITMDWNEYLLNIRDGQYENLRVKITGHEGNKVQILNGDQKLLRQIYNYCAGKYIFNRGKNIIIGKLLSKEETFHLRIVKNQIDNNIYFEKIFLQESSNQIQDSSFQTQITELPDQTIPEEIKIILELQRANVPNILPVLVLSDGTFYSYIYQKQKGVIQIKKYFQSIQKDKSCVIVHIARQLLILLIILEEKNIIMPSIHPNNIFINTDNLEILLSTYQFAYYVQKNDQIRKCLNFGYSPPEYFRQDQQITTQANIFQTGILLYYLLFDQTPYGKEFTDIFRNTLSNKPDFTPLQSCNSDLSNFIMNLLENDQNKRSRPKELLKHKIFNPKQLLKYSKLSLNVDIEEFDSFKNISNIQKVRTQLVKIQQNKQK